MDPGPNELVLEMDRNLPASRSTTFAAFIDPSELVKWFGPEDFTVRIHEFQARVGGPYRLQMQPPEGGAFFITGRFQTIEAPDALAYTFAYEEPDPDDVETLVEFAFRDAGRSSEVALTHGTFKTEARLSLHRVGWTDSFNKLERLLVSQA